MSKRNRNSAVRKLDPQTMEVIEVIGAGDVDPGLKDLIGDSHVEVGDSESAGGTDVGKMVGDVNPVAAAGYTLDGLRTDHKNKSGVIRFLASKGFQTKHISKFMDIRYQHVRNVLTTPLKKSGGSESAGEPATIED
jgi:hypothetical protein